MSVFSPLSAADSIECFLLGTHILTDRGEVAVEHLSIDDHVITADGKTEPIKWVGRRTIDSSCMSNPSRSYPIRIKAGALGDMCSTHGKKQCLPHRDLYVSPDHALFVDGLLVHAGALVNDVSIIKTEPVDTFVYYHIELYQHSLLVAEGAATESYLPQKEDRSWYDNSDEYQVLYPYHNILVYLPMSYPRLNHEKQLPRVVRKRLDRVAREIRDASMG